MSWSPPVEWKSAVAVAVVCGRPWPSMSWLVERCALSTVASTMPVSVPTDGPLPSVVESHGSAVSWLVEWKAAVEVTWVPSPVVDGATITAVGASV